MTWFDINNMKVNTDKFEYMVFGKHEGTYNIKIRDHVIESVDNVKILGLHIDNKLNFDTHISKVCQKTGRQIQVMSRLRNILSEGNKILLYNSFIECYFNYSSIIWHFCSKTNSLKLEKLQMKVLKLMSSNFDAS